MQRLAHLKNVLSAAGRAMSTSPSPASIERIFVWDFDNTLFSSPLPQRDLLDPSMLRILTGSHVTAVGWWTDPRSLHGPKDEGWSDDGWIWDEGRWCAEKWVQGPELAKGAWSCSKVTQSLADPHALTVLLTGRGLLKFNKTLRRMCHSRGLHFDLLGLKPPNDPTTGGWTLPFEPSAHKKGLPPKLSYVHERKEGEPVTRYMNTLLFKRTFLEALAKTFPGVKQISIFEDRAGHAKAFETIGREMIEQGLVEEFKSVLVPPLTAPMPPSSELAFCLHMIHESNSGLASGQTILHRDEDAMLTAERLDAEGNQVSVMDVERLPIDPEQAIGKDNVESMDCFRVLERGADGVLRTEHGHQAVPNDPAAGEWNPPGSSWFIVTYQGPPPYKERKVLGQLRNPHFLEVVRIRGVDGKMRLGVIPEPPLGKDAVDE